MDALTQLYDDVLSKLPISAVGHQDFEGKIAAFFEDLVNSNFIKYNKHITMLFSAMLDIPHDEDGKQKWQLKNYDSVFFKSFVSGDKKEVWSFFHYLLIKAKEKLNLNLIDELSVSKTLSELFTAEIDFKVSILNSSEIPIVTYDNINNVFEVKIPFGLYEVRENIDLLKYNLNKKWFKNNNGQNEHELFLSEDDKLKRPWQYKVDEIQDVISFEQVHDKYNHFKGIYDRYLDNDKIEQIANEIVEQLKYSSRYSLYPPDKEELFQKLAYCCIAVSFFCYYYDSSIEYMLSIARVDYDFKNGKETKEFRNIGGIIVGYRSGYEISSTERTIFNLVSDRMASVIVGQTLFRENLIYRRKANAEKMKTALNNFHNLDNEQDILHGKKVVTNDFENKFNIFFKANEVILTKEFQISYNALKKNNNEYICKYCLSRLKNDETRDGNCKIKIQNPIFQNEPTTGECAVNGISSQNFNIPLISSLIKHFFKHNHDSLPAKVIPSLKGDLLKYSITYQNVFDVNNFIDRLKNPELGSDCISKFFIDYYDSIDCHGIFSLECTIDKELKEFFNSRKTIMYVTNKKIILNKEYQFLERIKDDQLPTTITLKFFNELNLKK